MTSGVMTPRANKIRPGAPVCTECADRSQCVQCLRSVSFGGGLACGEIGRWVPGALAGHRGHRRGDGCCPPSPGREDSGGSDPSPRIGAHTGGERVFLGISRTDSRERTHLPPCTNPRRTKPTHQFVPVCVGAHCPTPTRGVHALLYVH